MEVNIQNQTSQTIQPQIKLQSKVPTSLIIKAVASYLIGIVGLFVIDTVFRYQIGNNNGALLILFSTAVIYLGPIIGLFYTGKIFLRLIRKKHENTIENTKIGKLKLIAIITLLLVGLSYIYIPIKYLARNVRNKVIGEEQVKNESIQKEALRQYPLYVSRFEGDKVVVSQVSQNQFEVDDGVITGVITLVNVKNDSTKDLSFLVGKRVTLKILSEEEFAEATQNSGMYDFPYYVYVYYEGKLVE